MSVLTGIAPNELLALDGEMFDAVLRAATTRWGAADGEHDEHERGEPERVSVARLADLATNVERVGVPS